MVELTTLQKALVTIKKLKKRLIEKDVFSPIAITGLGCRFPEAGDKDEFWQLLTEGKNVISPLSETRWDLLKHTQEPQMRDKNYSYAGGYLANIIDFDANFFGISPREALRMDPQQRLLLEVAFEALEDAGLSDRALKGSNTGVFTSLYQSQFGFIQETDSDLDALFIPTGNAVSIAANRLSYLLDLHGPSMVIDTACSSSLVALHLGCLHLQNNLCDLALVGGVNVNLLPSIHHLLSKAKMLSPEGQCKTFDAGANGYVPGEGCGVIVLKSLKKALADGDRIYCIINGMAINQDGKKNGLTAPNALQQEKVLKTAYKKADINPSYLSYIECHGTGTFLGDPIEVQALGNVISEQRNAGEPCWLGSVKTNLGHLEPAAGMASIIKVALALKYKKIPPHLNVTVPNPHISFEKYHFQIPTRVEEWPQYGEYRMAGVSGFGFGGQNVHLVLREMDLQTEHQYTQASATEDEIFTISAKDPAALIELAKKWEQQLKKKTFFSLSEVCYNTHIRRSHYNHRLAIVANSSDELIRSLSEFIIDRSRFHSRIFFNPISQPSTHAFNQRTIDLSHNSLQLAKAYVEGEYVNWQQYESHRFYPVFEMPLYPWQKKKYWPEFKNRHTKTESQSGHPYQAQQLSSPLNAIQFEFVLSNERVPELADTYHVLHAGYYLEMLAFAVNKISKQSHFQIENLEFLSALIIPSTIEKKIHLILKPIRNKKQIFSFYSQHDNDWVEHASGYLFLDTSQNENVDNIKQIKESHPKITADEIYAKIALTHMPTGESIRWSHAYWVQEKTILCEFREPKSCKSAQKFALNIHPGVIDGCIQPLFKLLPDNNIHSYMAAKIEKINFYGIKNAKLNLLAKLHLTNDTELTGSCYLITDDNETILELKNINLKKLKHSFAINKIFKDSSFNESEFSVFSKDEKYEYILEFLVDQSTDIFAIPSAELNTEIGLNDMGIDSLMSLVLVKSLEKKFKINYPVEKIIIGPTLHELAKDILGFMIEKSGDITIQENKWLAFNERRTAPKARLFCLPYGGGGASIYRDWAQFLPETIEVCPIQLPGRESRLDEPPITNFKPLISAIVSHIELYFDLPFALFGHSMGGLMAFEIARTCRKLGLPQPQQLFISAYPAPTTPPMRLNSMIKQLEEVGFNFLEMNALVLRQLNENQWKLLAEIFLSNGLMEYGGISKEAMEVVLPTFIGDMKIIKSYSYQDEARLKLPITIFTGSKDQWIAEEEYSDWQKQTQKNCIFKQFSAGHLFIKDILTKKSLLNIIQLALDPVTDDQFQQ